MQASRIEMFPIFRSTDLTRAVVELYLSEEELSISEVARRTDATRVAISKAVPDLVRAGIICKRTVGRTTMLKADTSSVTYWPLRQLLEITQGAPQVLEQEFAAVEGIDKIFIFGSWASRFTGLQGSSPGDIDVLVIGNPRRLDLHDAATRAEARLRREVNPLPCSLESWEKLEEPFLRAVSDKPMIAVKHERIELSDDESTQPRGDSPTPGGWAEELQR